MGVLWEKARFIAGHQPGAEIGGTIAGVAGLELGTCWPLELGANHKTPCWPTRRAAAPPCSAATAAARLRNPCTTACINGAVSSQEQPPHPAAQPLLQERSTATPPGKQWLRRPPEERPPGAPGAAGPPRRRPPPAAVASPPPRYTSPPAGRAAPAAPARLRQWGMGGFSRSGGGKRALGHASPGYLPGRLAKSSARWYTGKAGRGIRRPPWPPLT